MINGKKQKIKAYVKTDITTANRENILLALYDGAIVFLKKAIKAAEENNTQERTANVIKVQEIVSELRASLNFSVNSSLAKELERLYVFIGQRLLEGSLDNNPVFFKEALSVLEILNTGWKEAIASLKNVKHV